MHKKVLFLICLSSFFAFFGRAYQLYFFGAPYRAILWDEGLVAPILETIFGIKWSDYATSENVSINIGIFTKINSILFLIAAIVSLFWTSINQLKIKKWVIGIALIMFVILGVCIAIDKRNDLFQFFEMILQFTAPLALLSLKKPENVFKKKVIIWFKIALALTFIPHGLYAMGVIYVPGHFVDMTIQILGVTENVAKEFLFVVGLLDVLLVLILFVPNKFNNYILMYLIFWGFATAFARVIAGFNTDFPANSFHSLSFLTLYRLPHGLIPLCILILQKNNYTKIFKIRKPI